TPTRWREGVPIGTTRDDGGRTTATGGRQTPAGGPSSVERRSARPGYFNEPMAIQCSTPQAPGSWVRLQALKEPYSPGAGGGTPQLERRSGLGQGGEFRAPHRVPTLDTGQPAPILVVAVV